MKTPCTVCKRETELLPDGSREPHYPGPVLTLTPTHFCVTSGSAGIASLFLAQPVKRQRCGMCYAMVFVLPDGNFNVHFDVLREPCISSNRPADKYSPFDRDLGFAFDDRYKESVGTRRVCDLCGQEFRLDWDTGAMPRHYPNPTQTYSADRYCGEEYTWRGENMGVINFHYQPGLNSVYNL